MIKELKEFLVEATEILRQTNQNDYLMTIPQAAKRLSLPINTVYELINLGEIEVLTFRKARIRNYEVNDFLKRNAGRDFTQLLKGKEGQVYKIS